MKRPIRNSHGHRRTNLVFCAALVIGFFVLLMLFSHGHISDSDAPEQPKKDPVEEGPFIRPIDMAPNTIAEQPAAAAVVPEVGPAPPVEVLDLPTIREKSRSQEYVKPVVNSKQSIFMVIVIPTIARLGAGETYLKTTIQNLHKEIQRRTVDSNKAIKVLVQKNDPTKPHNSYSDLKESSEFHDLVVFHENSPRFEDPFEDIPGYNYRAPDNVRPGHVARQQNCDIVSIMENALEMFDFEYFMFMEDDFITCTGAFDTIMTSLKNAKSRQNDFCGLRVSYGMNGLIMPRKDVVNFAKYVRENIKELPIDLLIRNYMFGDSRLGSIDTCRISGRNLYVYKHVLSEHIGEISTFLERNNPDFRPRFPSCGDPMSRVWSLHEQEKFAPACLDDTLELSPCP